MRLIDIIILLFVALLLAICIKALVNNHKSGTPSCGAASCASCGVPCGMYKAAEMINNRKNRDTVR